MRDLYQALGLEPGVDTPAVKKAYRELTRRFHPDKNPGRAWATDRYKEIVSAYEVLSDERKRALYDEFGEVAFTRGFDPERARVARVTRRDASEPAGGDTGGGRWDPGAVEFADLEEVKRTGFEDLLGRVFGGWSGRTVEETAGLDLRAPLLVGTAELVGGATRPVRYRRADGEWATAEVVVPPGSRPGATLRLAGCGEPGDPPGDLLVDLQLELEPGLTVEGDDVHTTIDVPLRRLYQGGRLEVALPFGTFDVRVPPATAPHRTLRLRGRGLPGVGGRGDLIVAFRVVMPAKGDRALLEALSRLQPDD